MNDFSIAVFPEFLGPKTKHFSVFVAFLDLTVFFLLYEMQKQSHQYIQGTLG